MARSLQRSTHPRPRPRSPTGGCSSPSAPLQHAHRASDRRRSLPDGTPRCRPSTACRPGMARRSPPGHAHRREPPPRPGPHHAGPRGGISVESLDVRDVNTVIAELSLSEGAAAGTRSVILRTGDDVVRAPDAFEVLDAEAGPPSTVWRRADRARRLVDLRIAPPGGHPGRRTRTLARSRRRRRVRHRSGEARRPRRDRRRRPARRPARRARRWRPPAAGPRRRGAGPAPAVPPGCTVARSRSAWVGCSWASPPCSGAAAGAPRMRPTRPWPAAGDGDGSGSPGPPVRATHPSGRPPAPPTSSRWSAPCPPAPTAGPRSPSRRARAPGG